MSRKSSQSRADSSESTTTRWQRPIESTGVMARDLAGRVGNVHVLGVLHTTPTAIARVTGAITRYKPDVVAIEACAKAVGQYHPDNHDPRWPPDDELEAAAYATVRDYDLLLAGLDTQSYDTDTDFAQLDAEIFTELGLLADDEHLTLATYYDLTWSLIRDWRQKTKARAPDAYQTVLTDRDSVMAGHLHALATHGDIDTVVAAVGLQHLPGILFRLRTGLISDSKITPPPIADYRLFPRDSPHSQA